MKRESTEDLNVNQNYCLLCSLEIGLRSSKIPTVIETHTFFLPPVPTFAQIETNPLKQQRRFAKNCNQHRENEKLKKGKEPGGGWVCV